MILWKVGIYYYWHPETFYLRQTLMFRKAWKWGISLGTNNSCSPLTPSIESNLPCMASNGSKLVENLPNITRYNNLSYLKFKGLKRAQNGDLDHKGLRSLTILRGCTRSYLPNPLLYHNLAEIPCYSDFAQTTSKFCN